jgi:CheY-like chemotaxis protein
MTSNDILALVIEDDPFLAEIFSKALESVGYKTDIVSEGRTALVRLAETTPALVTLDLHLPGISGRDLLSFIRRERHLTHTRVILTTADSATANLMAPEAELVLLKPISVNQLRELALRLRVRDRAYMR